MFELTLTFDNGPEPDVTPGVLDLLVRKNILSTFFVLGRKIADPERRKLAQRAQAEGHWIGNHSMQHQVPLGEASDPVAAAQQEISDAQHLLGSLSHPRRFFRPFGRGGTLGPHLLSRPALNLLKADGHTLVLWNSIPRDWCEPDNWVETALAQCLDQPKTLMVLHDLPTGAMKHLERFIDLAQQAGGQFRQDYPSDCVPIVSGQVVGDVEQFVHPST
ncbi:MAG: polysaccharide deacetylase family protein [Burkholderiaceae bacterium]